MSVVDQIYDTLLKQDMKPKLSRHKRVIRIAMLVLNLVRAMVVCIMSSMKKVTARKWTWIQALHQPTKVCGRTWLATFHQLLDTKYLQLFFNFFFSVTYDVMLCCVTTSQRKSSYGSYFF